MWVRIPHLPLIKSINMKQYRTDLEKNRIEFIDNRFYLSGNGMYIPSVTTILDSYPKTADFYAWLKKVGEDADSIRDEAGRRGSVVHDLTERYDNMEEVSFINQNGLKYKMSEWAMFERYVEFSTIFKHEIIMMESHMISEELGFAGTVDRVIDLDGNRMLMDIKTSNAIHDSYWLQLAAYHRLLMEYGQEIDSVGILWLNAKTRTAGKAGAIQGPGWQLVSKRVDEVEKDWQLFKCTYELWKHVNETMRPKNISYQLTHQKK